MSPLTPLTPYLTCPMSFLGSHDSPSLVTHPPSFRMCIYRHTCIVYRPAWLGQNAPFYMYVVSSVSFCILYIQHIIIQTYMIKINEPQLPWLRTAIYHTGLDVKMEVTTCKTQQTQRRKIPTRLGSQWRQGR